MVRSTTNLNEPNMTMTWEQAQAHIDALNQQVNILTDQLQQLTTRAAAADTQHQQIHQELERTKVLLAAGGKGQEFKLIDPKTMCPNKLGTQTPWKQWAEDTRAYVSMLSRPLANSLKLVEGREAKLTTAEIESAEIPEHHAAQLSRYLHLRSEGNSNTLIKASQERGEHAL